MPMQQNFVQDQREEDVYSSESSSLSSETSEDEGTYRDNNNPVGPPSGDESYSSVS